MRQHVSTRRRLIGIGTMLAIGGAVIAMPAPDTAIQQQQANANRPQTVDLDDLEKNPGKYLGKTVTVEGEVQRVLGPNLFTIDERNWVDLDRELPVVVPDPLAAIVHGDQPVRVTGTVQKVPIAQIERRGGLLGDPKIKAEITAQPALLAQEVSARGPGAVAINLLVRPDAPVGTSGSGATVTDANQIGRASDTSMVGRRVNLAEVKIGEVGNRGFWIMTPSGERIFVMTPNKTGVKTGQSASVQGVVLELPEGLKVELKASGEPVYIFAERVAAR